MRVVPRPVRTDLSRRLAVLAAVALCWTVAQADDSTAESPVFDVTQLAEGIHLFRPPSDRTDLTNALVVAREDGLLVVGAQPSPRAAEQFLSDLRALSSQPVRYLVLPHPHAEAAGGAAAFPAGTLVIGTNGCDEALRDPAFDFGAEARARAENRGGWTDPPRRHPTLVCHARTRLADARNPVEILPLPTAHTRGDLLVHLPSQRIVFGGALLFPDRNPYAVGGNIGGWLATLNNIAKMTPAAVVPLRGPTLDAREVRVLRDSFAWLRGRIDLGFVEGHNAQGVTQFALEAEELPRRFDTEARPGFVRTVVDQAVEEAVEGRRKRGLPY